jgi:maltodextrin utilization protein YvdJ
MDSAKRRKRIKTFFEKNEYYIFMVIMVIVAIVFIISYFLVDGGSSYIGP